MFGLLNPHVIITALGIVGVIGVIFAETGLFFGFFFPGDSLLFTAGFLASQHQISFVWLLGGALVAAIIGDSFGYAFGKKIGPALFNREASFFFDKRNIVRAQHFYEKYGKKTIIIARFIPIIRTFAPIVAGIAEMPYGAFIRFNIIGAFGWTWAMLWLGFGFGSIIPDPDRYVIPAIAVIIIISAAPALREIFRNVLK